ncbi:hypothetical protein PXH66_03315 [Synoicihabitans lomoniglobus]|uniref:Uncharacterized protein n=1 Tax=Synoicihabitans lomoniglobus TaxID=2909285 RepID=A0AAF0CPV7_9BACT|nr:hypothetical protein PXH66_03315 [Opitutaceae bacterium LMO-M01]
MTSREKALEARLRRKLSELEEQIADAEVKALLPPATCTQVELYVQCQQDRIKALEHEVTCYTAELDYLLERTKPSDQLELLTLNQANGTHGKTPEPATV